MATNRLRSTHPPRIRQYTAPSAEALRKELDPEHALCERRHHRGDPDPRMDPTEGRVAGERAGQQRPEAHQPDRGPADRQVGGLPELEVRTEPKGARDPGEPGEDHQREA